MYQHYITIAVAVLCLSGFVCLYVRVYTQRVCYFHSTPSSTKASCHSKRVSGLKHSLDMDTFSPTLQHVTDNKRQKGQKNEASQDIRILHI